MELHIPSQLNLDLLHLHWSLQLTMLNFYSDNSGCYNWSHFGGAFLFRSTN